MSDGECDLTGRATQSRGWSLRPADSVETAAPSAHEPRLHHFGIMGLFGELAHTVGLVEPLQGLVEAGSPRIEEPRIRGCTLPCPLCQDQLAGVAELVLVEEGRQIGLEVARPQKVRPREGG